MKNNKEMISIEKEQFHKFKELMDLACDKIESLENIIKEQKEQIEQNKIVDISEQLSKFEEVMNIGKEYGEDELSEQGVQEWTTKEY